MANVGFDFKFTGFEALANQIERLPQAVIKAAAASLTASYEEILTDSKENYVPIDTGALSASGNVQVTVNGDRIEVVIGFGGPSAPYAVAVHEIQKNYRGGRTFKYLEIPLKAALPKIGGDLYADINDAMESL